MEAEGLPRQELLGRLVRGSQGGEVPLPRLGSVVEVRSSLVLS